MRYLTIVLIALLFVSCKQTDTSKKEITTESTPEIALQNFDTEAGKYTGKEVIVSGIVDHVCKHGGKKLLLVNDDADVHITSDERFSDELIGSKISLHGIVLEERISEATCLQMEEDNMKSHSEGKSSDEQFEAKKEHIKKYREQIAKSDIDYISNYSLDFVSLEEVK